MWTKFTKVLLQYDHKYSRILKSIVYFVSYIDVIKSYSKSALNNNYNKPTINNVHKDKSYINVKALRHPIVERINTKLEYIPNNIKNYYTKIWKTY